MAQTALFMGPMAKKKIVSQKYSPNSYRVISHNAEEIYPGKPTMLTTFTTTSDFNVIGQRSAPCRPLLEHRQNRPNATNVGFLRQDVKLMNAPVCDVYTAETSPEQGSWWPSRTSREPLKVPPHTLDTTVRADFQNRSADVKGNTRHAANPNKEPALGSVPVNFLRKPNGKQRFWKEGLSYEHQFNCRSDPAYPTRGKRQGSFVWDEFPPPEVGRMMHAYGYVDNKSQQTLPPVEPPVEKKPESGKASRKSSTSVGQQTETAARQNIGTETSAIAPVAM